MTKLIDILKPEVSEALLLGQLRVLMKQPQGMSDPQCCMLKMTGLLVWHVRMDI